LTELNKAKPLMKRKHSYRISIINMMRWEPYPNEPLPHLFLQHTTILICLQSFKTCKSLPVNTDTDPFSNAQIMMTANVIYNNWSYNSTGFHSNRTYFIVCSNTLQILWKYELKLPKSYSQLMRMMWSTQTMQREHSMLQHSENLSIHDIQHYT